MRRAYGGAPLGRGQNGANLASLSHPFVAHGARSYRPTVPPRNITWPMLRHINSPRGAAAMKGVRLSMWPFEQRGKSKSAMRVRTGEATCHTPVQQPSVYRLETMDLREPRACVFRYPLVSTARGTALWDWYPVVSAMLPDVSPSSQWYSPDCVGREGQRT